MKKYIRKLRSESKTVRVRVTMYFLKIFLVTVAVLFSFAYFYIQQVKIENSRLYLEQNLTSVNGAINAFVENTDRLINGSFLDYQFQTQFDESSSKLSKNRIISNSLTGILLQDMNINSTVFFMGAESRYETASGNVYQINPLETMKKDWVEKINKSDGNVVCFNNGGGAIKIVNRKGENIPFLAFVRDIKRLTNYERIGILSINVTCENFINTIKRSIKEDDQHLYIYNSDGELIGSSDSSEIYLKTAEKFYNSSEIFDTEKISKDRIALCKMPSDFSDWTLICISPLNISKSMYDYFIVFSLLLGFLCIGIIFGGQFYITKNVSKPLENLVSHMNHVERGFLSEIDISNKKNIEFEEILNLHLIFNKMISSINNLIFKIEEESRIKRHNEISLLQAQIKPHFLHNALDAVSALVLIKDNDTAFKLTQALGQFYKTSLSSGLEVVDIKTELECIENYIIVLNIRYKNKINMIYDVPKEIYNYKILKLILQPLVENSVYHGIRNKEGIGTIKISAEKQNNKIIFSIEDDGVGMTEERITEVLKKSSRSSTKGFGVYSLIQKLELFYEIKSPINIESQVGKGTKITVLIGILEGNND